MLFRLFRAVQRKIDLRILWPVCKEEATNASGDLQLAREAFFFHCINDTAWNKDYTPQELRTYIWGLT